jgi:hypothetical protein
LRCIKTVDQEHEKALFDFDEEIDDLENVENRYPVAPQPQAPKPPLSKVPA